MNESKLNEYLDEYARKYSPEPSRALVDSIMDIPREVEQNPVFSLPKRLSDWFLFLVPRLSGLTAACALGLYMGSAGGTALAEDEIAEIEQEAFNIAGGETVLDENTETLLDLEEFIFVEETVE
ncbi:hypothetical protein [Pseudemcibacter aquimaris]|uniref:hypothetical protein n=1 Tax=Pseudemcibacter aquimaris TaxID=2857064 RepID=UPI0020120577|nr:hypothetical protein [Pseudemcibacter aquimaris]MCC3860071.1 hypothetical protein [Pseudemcibacter aquimaris]WDU57400.1 hypothetical protein KW060_09335 [Pseudemcibacter aquimaris]